MKILAVDPGHTTGYVKAVFNPPEEDYDILPFDSCVHIANTGHWSSMEDLEDLIPDLFHKTDFVVCERYVIYPNRAESHVGDHLYPVQVIGRVKWLAWRLCCVDVVEQSASQAKQRWPDSRMWKYFPGIRNFSPHIQDAMRHLLTYIEINHS